MNQQSEQNEKLVIGLHEGAIVGKYLRLILGILALGFWLPDCIKGTGDKVTLIFMGIFLLGYFVAIWLQYYTLVFDEEGCTKQFMFYHRKYTWDQLVVRQEYSANAEDEYECDIYREGIIFRTKKKRTHRKHNIGTYELLDPFGSIVANYEGTYMWNYVKGGYVGRGCEVNKELFLQKLAEWEIDISRVDEEEKSDLEILNQLIAQNDKKVNEYGKQGMRLFVIVISACLIPMAIKCRTIEERLVVLVYFMFCIWLIIMQWCMEYKVVIDKYGCTKIWWKYRKKYTWDELTVRKICSPMGNYEEGVLFATCWKSSKEKDPKKYCDRHPFSSMVVNFKGMCKMKENLGDQCAVDKELLLQCLAEWGIELEDARKKDNK